MPDCLASLERQTLRPAKIEKVENVTPLSKAFAERLRKARTKYYIQVDADMVLHRHCVETLYNMMQRNPKCFLAKGLLRDDIIGKIGFIKLWNREAIGDTKVRDVIGCDRDFEKRLKEKGFVEERIERILGHHINTFDRKSTFFKYKRKAEKAQAFGDPYQWMVGSIAKNLDREWSLMSYYALAGYFAGLYNPEPNLEKEVDIGERKNDPVFGKAHQFLMNPYSEFEYLTNQALFYHRRQLEHLAGDFLQRAEQLLEDEPFDGLKLYRYGSMLKKMGQNEPAAVYFQKVVETEHPIPDEWRGGAYFHLGEIHWRKKEFEPGRYCFKQCLEHIPNHQAAQTYLLPEKEKK